jgi:AAA15 family ATPase/GTPase
MAQLTGLGIENFRIFKDYTAFEFAPITLLTGANNSGKSSLIKALLLLAVNANKKLERFTLDFEEKTRTTKLGDFFSVANTINKPIKFVLNFKNLEKELGRPVHHEKLADEIFQKLAAKPFIIEMQFDAQKENNMINFSFYCMDKEEKVKLLDFDFIEKAQRVGKQEVNYIWLEKFIYAIEAKPFKNKEKKLKEINNSIERFNDLFSVIDLAFNTNGDKDLKTYHFGMLDDILKKLVEIALEILEFGDKIEYLPAFRGNQERFYSYESDLALNRLLKQFTDKGFNEESKEQIYLNDWIERLGIGKKIELIPDGGGTKVNIINGTDRPMADYGFGITQYLPLLLKIVLNPNKLLLIEEGENSLHPNFQSLLADLLIDAHKTFGINFIVETHSEYLLRKMQVLVKQKFKDIIPKHIVVFYFKNSDTLESNEIQINKIYIDESGNLIGEFGEGFIDEADDLALKLLKLKHK